MLEFVKMAPECKAHFVFPPFLPDRMTRVYVGGLPANVRERDLEDIFYKVSCWPVFIAGAGEVSWRNRGILSVLLSASFHPFFFLTC